MQAILLIAICSAPPVFAQGCMHFSEADSQTRIARPDPSNASALLHFKRWKARYLRPVMCGMVFCGGSCASYSDACLLWQRPILQIQESLAFGEAP
jgi:hypothetical protein